MYIGVYVGTFIANFGEEYGDEEPDIMLILYHISISSCLSNYVDMKYHNRVDGFHINLEN